IRLAKRTTASLCRILVALSSTSKVAIHCRQVGNRASKEIRVKGSFAMPTVGLRVRVAGEGLGGLLEKEPPLVSSSLIGEVIVSSTGSDGLDEEGISGIGSVDATPELGAGQNGIGKGCGSTIGDGGGGETSCG
nr:hypothetical protein [Tanacetum cinerariifolium]